MKVLFRLLCLLAGCALLGGCTDPRYRMPTVKLRSGSEIERRATLSTLRRTWAERPRDICPDGNLYERALLNRASFFGRQIKGTETYRPACDFWMQCVRDHISSYEEDAHKFQN